MKPFVETVVRVAAPGDRPHPVDRRTPVAVGARDGGTGLTVELSDGTSVRADLVVNCTGRSTAP
jgi:2-polyprenyl-6-methoxyphenol hydroxylase-like FAD-dependent oxidoreductase